MKRIMLERIKSLFLIVLVALSLIQVGILWYYQNHRLPISFLSTLYTMLNQKSPPDLTAVKEEVFMPSRIIVSDEYAVSRWILASDADNKYYKKLWREAYFNIQTILSDSFSQKPEILPGNEWSSINRPFTFEFGTGMDIEVIKYLSGLKKSSSPNAPAGIAKMAVDPWVDQNEKNTVYFLYNGNVYKYTLSFMKNSFKREDYLDIITGLNNDKSDINYNAYSYIDPNRTLRYPIGPEVPIVIQSSSKADIPAISAYIPDSLVLKYNNNGDPDPSGIEKLLLGSETEMFDPPETDGQGTVTLKNANNIFKQYRNGLLEYSYWSRVSGEDRGDIKSALQKAFEFVVEKRKLFGRTPAYKLQLSGIGLTQDKNAYEFAFDYVINGIPVVFKEIKSGSGKKIRTAITLQVNSKGVVSCWWMVRNFKQEQPVVNTYYNIHFEEFLKSYKAEYGELKGSRNLTIADMETAYQDSSVASRHRLVPVWSLKTYDEKGNTGSRLVKIPVWKEK